MNPRKVPFTICFEGPSGVGKTTMCKLLSNDFNIVPEVNLLFEKNGTESKTWYHEKQVQRFQLCKDSLKNSILDGDIFQAIWYNWACNYPSNFLGKEETHLFYRKRVAEGNLKFPDLYIILEADDSELRIRKEKDTLRRRRNFEKHLKIISPLKEYYQFLSDETDLDLTFIQYDSIKTTKASVLKEIKNFEIRKRDDKMIFSQIENWINNK